MKRFPYETNSTAEWLQEVLQKSCTSAGLQQSQILVAVESPLKAINSAFAVVQKIPESRSGLQSGGKVALKRMLLPVVAYHSLVHKKRNAGSNNTIILIHGRGVDKSKCNLYFIRHITNLQQSHVVNI